MLLIVFEGEQWKAPGTIYQRVTMQILNNDRKALIKLQPLRRAGSQSQGVRSFALIMSHSRYSQPVREN